MGLLSTFAAVACVIATTIFPAGAIDWPVFGFNPDRTSFNPVESTLTVGNVHRLRERWQVSLGAVADSTPILLQQVRVGRHLRPMLFETTKNGMTLGIEAITGRIVWRFLTHGPNYTHSTPAADPSRKAIYVGGVDGKVHKLDASTGHDIHAPGFPAQITMAPATEANESSLNVANGYLYATLSGYNGDGTPYDGHIVSVRLSDGATKVFNTLCSEKHHLIQPNSCSAQRSGIWARGGVVVDPDSSMNGRIYVATGNADFNASRGGNNYGDSVLSLSADLSNFLGSYTPPDDKRLQNEDLDLGSTSPAVLPVEGSSQTPWMLVQGGKDGVLRLLNRAALPGVGNELQLVTLPDRLFSTPAVWTDSAKQVWIFMGFPDVVEAMRLETNKAGVSKLAQMWQSRAGETGEGTSVVVANGMLFVAVDGAIVALDAVNGKLLWSSAMRSAGKTIGPVHWESPIVVNGWVYCSDENGRLTAYSLR
ncbi:MAG TPA: PQQ-binding-like beta-propeller repeat protein [Candidatus Cybelea sp.]